MRLAPERNGFDPVRFRAWDSNASEAVITALRHAIREESQLMDQWRAISVQFGLPHPDLIGTVTGSARYEQPNIEV